MLYILPGSFFYIEEIHLKGLDGVFVFEKGPTTGKQIVRPILEQRRREGGPVQTRGSTCQKALFHGVWICPGFVYRTPGKRNIDESSLLAGSTSNPHASQ